MIAAKLLRSLFTRQTKPRTVRLGFDSLERRDTPSGTVSAVLRGKTWTITGDAEANDISIDPTSTPGTFSLYGTNNTTITGVTDPVGVEHIVVRLGDGDDTCYFNITGNMGALAGNLQFQGGNGANSVIIEDMSIGKNLRIFNGTNLTGVDNFVLESVDVQGNVQVKNGNGDSNTELSRQGVGTSTIGGSLLIHNGTGKDVTTIADYNINGSVRAANGGPDSNNVPGSFQMLNRNNTTYSVVGKDVNVRYNGGQNAGSERDGIWDYSIGRNVRFNYVGGKGDVRFDGYNMNQPTVIHGHLNINATGKLVVNVGANGYQYAGLLVSKNVTITSGKGHDEINLFNLFVEGSTTLNLGHGDDRVEINDSIFRKFTMNTGGGDDQVSIETHTGTARDTNIYGVFTINLGYGNDRCDLGITGDDLGYLTLDRKGAIVGGNGEDTINTFNVASFNGSLLIIQP